MLLDPLVDPLALLREQSATGKNADGEQDDDDDPRQEGVPGEKVFPVAAQERHSATTARDERNSLLLGRGKDTTRDTNIKAAATLRAHHFAVRRRELEAATDHSNRRDEIDAATEEREIALIGALNEPSECAGFRLRVYA